MRLKQILPILILVLAALLSACQNDAEPQVLPTLVDLNALATENAATAQAGQAAIVPTAAQRDTLPPTWTPSPIPEPTAQEAFPSPTPEAALSSVPGRIYYLINNDAIVMLDPNSGYEELLSIPQLGQDLSSLMLSPDGQWLAYIAPGSGSAQEIFITHTRNGETHQLSELGFSQIALPTWSHDSQSVAFIAAQGDGSPLGIYRAVMGTRGQTLLTQQPGAAITSLAWNETNERIYFNNEIIQAVDVATGIVSIELTAPTGFGPDHSLSHSPRDNYLYYLKTARNFNTNITSGTLSGLIFTSYGETPAELKTNLAELTTLRHSLDGEWLLMGGANNILIQNNLMMSVETLLTGGRMAPQPALSPDAAWVAFTDLDAQGIPQIFMLPNGEGGIRQLTFHQEGQISDLQWGLN
jgi:Tol biopolymer transport system component